MRAPLPRPAVELLGPPAAQDLGLRLDELEGRVAALREPHMRRAVVVELVETLEADALVAFLVMLLDRNRRGLDRSRTVLQQLALEPTVFQEMPYERVQAAYNAARDANMDGVAKLFLGAALQAELDENRGPPGNRHLDIPLGNRRALARGRDRFTLDRLLHDRDHRVIAILLDNPRIVERDVVRIAAMRPTRGEVLRTIAGHGRWSTRYRVRKALACNPWTPDAIARRLLPTLMRQDVRHALESGVLPPELEDEARAVLRQRVRVMESWEE